MLLSVTVMKLTPGEGLVQGEESKHPEESLCHESVREQTDSNWNRPYRGRMEQKVKGKWRLDQVGPPRPRGDFGYVFLSK